MAGTILETTTELVIVTNDFTMTSSYSGAAKPILSYLVNFHVTDGTDPVVP